MEEGKDHHVDDHEKKDSEHESEIQSLVEDKTQISIDNNPDKKFKPAEFKKTVKKNPWIIATIVLGIIALVLLVFMLRGGITGNIITGRVIGEEDISSKTVDFVNTNLLPPGQGQVTFNSISEKSGLYEVLVLYQGREVPIYVTKDGEFMTQALIPMDELNQTQPNELMEISIDDDAVKGNSDAPVTIIEFSDYECPFCGRHFEQTYSQIVKEYVDTGKVKLVFRDFPLDFHESAQKAAEAAECAGEQGKYWEMHDKLFENQNALDVDSLKQYAKDIGLNTANFDSCLDSGEMEDEVKEDMVDGQNYGVSGTPAFFINGRLLTGAQPFSAFKEIIDSELEKQ